LGGKEEGEMGEEGVSTLRGIEVRNVGLMKEEGTS